MVAVPQFSPAPALESCARCLTRHGGDSRTGVFPCIARYTNEQGERLCIFCWDGAVCPPQLRRLAQSKAALRILEPGSPNKKGVAVPTTAVPAMLSPEKPEQLPKHSISPRAVIHPTSKPQEDHKMIAAISTAPTSRTSAVSAAARVCTSCKKNPLSYNNKTEICGACQREGGGRLRSENAVRRAQPHRGLKIERAAQPAAVTARVESRVDLLLAAIPREEKARMLCAWMAGSL
jgi:hypothetical protein